VAQRRVVAGPHRADVNDAGLLQRRRPPPELGEPGVARMREQQSARLLADGRRHEPAERHRRQVPHGDRCIAAVGHHRGRPERLGAGAVLQPGPHLHAGRGIPLQQRQDRDPVHLGLVVADLAQPSRRRVPAVLGVGAGAHPALGAERHLDQRYRMHQVLLRPVVVGVGRHTDQPDRGVGGGDQADLPGAEPPADPGKAGSDDRRAGGGLGVAGNGRVVQVRPGRVDVGRVPVGPVDVGRVGPLLGLVGGHGVVAPPRCSGPDDGLTSGPTRQCPARTASGKARTQ